MTININPGATIPLGQPSTQAAQKTIPSGASIPSGQPASSGSLPIMKMTVKKKLPTGVASNVKQHCYFLLDESSSMSGPKISELDMAMASLLPPLADPSNKDGFRVTIIPFNHSSYVHCSGVPAVSVPPLNLSASGGTNFDSPVLKAIAAIRSHKSAPNPDGWQYLQSQVFILTDGHGPIADKNIHELQELANVTAIAYGADADQATLSRLASDGQVHVVGTDGGALRDFLAHVGATMVSTIKAAM